MVAIYEHVVSVQADDIDQQGHVNNLRYVAWMQDAAVAHSTAVGWPAARYRDVGMWWVVRSHSIKYLSPAHIKEALVVQTWVSTMKRSSSLRRFRFLRPIDEQVLAMAETTWALVDQSTRAPVRIPAAMRDSFVVDEQEDEPARERRATNETSADPAGYGSHGRPALEHRIPRPPAY